MPRKTSTQKIRTVVHSDDKPITVALAKKLLGWEEVEKNHLLKDVDGRKISCSNNLKNRPISKANYDTLKQEILRRKWRFNGEPIIVGSEGGILNGQHTLIALILASQEMEQNPELWEVYWQSEPTIDKLIVYGVPEEDLIINTMDTCKPRTLADVIYRSEFFADLNSVQRKKASKIAESAIKMMWHRTGASLDAFAPRRTHAESLDFIDRHPTLLKCVSFIFNEDGKEKSLSNYLSPGYASALLYLMASSSSELMSYYSSPEDRVEDNLDFESMERAQDFWCELHAGEDFQPVRKMLGNLLNEGTSSIAVKCAVIIKAWEQYLLEEPITTKSIKLKFVANEYDIMELAETPICGGIDLGNPDEEPQADDITTIRERAKKEELQSKKRKQAEESPTKSKKRAKVRSIDVDDKVLCRCEDEEGNWKGVVVEVVGAGAQKVARVKVSNGFPQAGNVFEHPYDQLEKDS